MLGFRAIWRGALCALLLSLLCSAPAMAAAPNIFGTLNNSPSVEEGADPITLEPLVTVTDTDNAVQSATVTIDAADYQAGDVLGYAPAPASEIAMLPAGPGSIFLYAPDGSATPATMSTALRMVTYQHTGNTPIAVKDYSFSVTDGVSTASFSESVAVEAVNDTPTVLTNAAGALTFTEGDAATVVAPALTVTDPESNQIDLATVTLTGAQPGDVLDAPSSAAYTKTFDSGVLTINWNVNVPLAVAQSVLRTVTFSAGGGDDPELAARTAAFRVTEGLVDVEASAPGNRAISVVAVNDGPSVSGSWANAAGTPSAVAEQAASALVISNNVAVADPDAGIENVRVKLLDGQTGDVLSITTPNPVFSEATVSTVEAGTEFLVSGPVADVNSTLRTVGFAHTGDNPSTATRRVVLTATDVGGLTAGATHHVTVTPVNDVPQVSALGGPVAYTEDSPAVVLAPLAVINEPEGNIDELRLTVIGGNADWDQLTIGALPAAISADVGFDHVILSGNGTVAQYQEALRSIKFRDLRTVDYADRDLVVNVRASDTVGDGATQQLLIQDRDRNDPAGLAASGGATTFTEDGDAVPVDAGITVVDEDTVSALTGAIVSLTDGAAEDCLAYTGTRTDVVVDECTVTFVHTGTAADYQAELRKVVFSSTDQHGGVTRHVSFAPAGNTAVTKDVAIAAVEDAPVLTVPVDAVTFTEGGATALPGAGLTIADIDSTQLTGATVAISGGRQTGDVLALGEGVPAGITAEYTAATGTLALTGAGTLAEYQAALRSVTFATGDNPGGDDRTIAFKASDAGGPSTAAVRTVTVESVADAPVVTTTAAQLAWSKEAGAAAVDSGLEIADADSAQLAGATVKIIDGLKAAEDKLALASPPAGISAAFDAATGTLTLTGAATLAAYRDALRAVTYESTAASPQAGARRVRFTADDGEATGSAERTVNVGSATAPVAPKITQSPSGTTEATTAVIAFTGVEGAAFECSRNGGDFAGCTSPVTLTGLAAGAQSFKVRQRVGGGDASPAAEATWTVVTTAAPVPTALTIDIGSAAKPVLQVTGNAVAVPCKANQGTLGACGVAITAGGVTIASAVLNGGATAVTLNADGIAQLKASPLGLTVTITAASTVAGKTLQATRTAVLFGTGKLSLKRSALFASKSTAKLSAAGKRTLATIARAGARMSAIKCGASARSSKLAKARGKAVCAQLKKSGATAGRFSSTGKRSSRSDAVTITATR
jgi:hypothetical protein